MHICTYPRVRFGTRAFVCLLVCVGCLICAQGWDANDQLHVTVCVGEHCTSADISKCFPVCDHNSHLGDRTPDDDEDEEQIIMSEEEDEHGHYEQERKRYLINNLPCFTV